MPRVCYNESTDMDLKSHLQNAELLRSPDEWRQLRMLMTCDDELLAALFEKAMVPPRSLNIRAMNRGELEVLRADLEQKGALSIPTMHQGSVVVGGVEHSLVFVAATDIDPNHSHHGEMSTMLYLRDHVQAARTMMELYLCDSARYKKEGETGRQLLLSALHLMSTPRQLERFTGVASRGLAAGQGDWPHISFWFNDLQAERPNGWRNKQDSFQMLAHLTLDAIDRGFIATDQLLDAHKRFLESIVPLLRSVGFPNYESSGSWEENCARRTSVMAIETALLIKMQDAASRYDACAFLADEMLDRMIADGLKEVGRRLPFESPDYPSDSIKYRRADATLAYVLLYDLPAELARRKVPIGKDGRLMNATEIETLILDELASLDDPMTGGMVRYRGDSYQGVNFHTNTAQWVVRAIKQKVSRATDEPDLDEKQRLRRMLMPSGREAAWLHPLGQLSAWAAHRSLETTGGASDRYRNLGITYLDRTLGLLTGSDMWCTAIGDDGAYHLVRVPAAKLPECYVTYRYEGEELIIPSPHTPLNWAAACAKEAIGLLTTSRC